MEVALLFRNDRTILCDLVMDGPDLLKGHDLESAVIISLFSDRRASNDDRIIEDDWRGWWADTFMVNLNYKIGSRLWLLFREKQTSEVLNRAYEYVAEALQWLIDENIVRLINIDCEWVGKGTLGIKLEIYKPDGSSNTFKYQYVWDQL